MKNEAFLEFLEKEIFYGKIFKDEVAIDFFENNIKQAGININNLDISNLDIKIKDTYLVAESQHKDLKDREMYEYVNRDAEGKIIDCDWKEVCYYYVENKFLQSAEEITISDGENKTKIYYAAYESLGTDNIEHPKYLLLDEKAYKENFKSLSLQEAIERGLDLQYIKKAEEFGKDFQINPKDEKLFLTVLKYGDVEILKYLVEEKGLEINANNLYKPNDLLLEPELIKAIEERYSFRQDKKENDGFYFYNKAESVESVLDSYINQSDKNDKMIKYAKNEKQDSFDIYDKTEYMFSDYNVRIFKNINMLEYLKNEKGLDINLEKMEENKSLLTFLKLYIDIPDTSLVCNKGLRDNVFRYCSQIDGFDKILINVLENQNLAFLEHFERKSYVTDEFHTSLFQESICNERNDILKYLIEEKNMEVKKDDLVLAFECKNLEAVDYMIDKIDINKINMERPESERGPEYCQALANLKEYLEEKGEKNKEDSIDLTS